MYSKSYQNLSDRFLIKQFIDNNNIYTINITIDNDNIVAITGYNDENDIVLIPDKILTTVINDINECLRENDIL